MDIDDSNKPVHAWHAVSSFGPSPKFKNEKDVIRAAIEYFDWAENNPLRPPGSTDDKRAKHRLKTVMGLCTYLSIPRTTYHDWLAGEAGPKMQAAAEWVDDVLKQNALELAASDLVNSGLIARLLAVNETVQITQHVTHKQENKEGKQSAAELEAELEKIVTDVTGRPFKIERSPSPIDHRPDKGPHDS